MKIVVDKYPNKPKDCLFSEGDYFNGIEYAQYRCRLSGEVCHDKDASWHGTANGCKYLITLRDND